MPVSSENIYKAINIISKHTGGAMSWNDLIGCVSYFGENSFPKEFRLGMAKLGSGGKLRQNHEKSPLYVTVYSEQETPEILALRDLINKELAELN